VPENPWTNGAIEILFAFYISDIYNQNKTVRLHYQANNVIKVQTVSK